MYAINYLIHRKVLCGVKWTWQSICHIGRTGGQRPSNLYDSYDSSVVQVRPGTTRCRLRQSRRTWSWSSSPTSSAPRRQSTGQTKVNIRSVTSLFARLFVSWSVKISLKGGQVHYRSTCHLLARVPRRRLSCFLFAQVSFFERLILMCLLHKGSSAPIGAWKCN